MSDEHETRHREYVTLPSEQFCNGDEAITRDEWHRRWNLTRPTNDTGEAA